jgi:hypothetical protein
MSISKHGTGHGIQNSSPDRPGSHIHILNPVLVLKHKLDVSWMLFGPSLLASDEALPSSEASLQGLFT